MVGMGPDRAGRSGAGVCEAEGVQPDPYSN